VKKVHTLCIHARFASPRSRQDQYLSRVIINQGLEEMARGDEYGRDFLQRALALQLEFYRGHVE
jgi:hypothetical protein